MAPPPGSRATSLRRPGRGKRLSSAYTRCVVRVIRKPLRRPPLFLILSGLILSGAISPAAQAQDETAVCPCFNFEEVEGVFLSGDKLLASGGGGSCQVNDYSVEFIGEVVVIDKDYKTLARASVKWADFDPGQCDYRNATAEPVIERTEYWPHPAPEATARACLEVISSVIAKLDTTGRCRKYP